MLSLVFLIISLIGLVLTSVFFFLRIDTSGTAETILLIALIVSLVLVVFFTILTIRKYYSRKSSILQKRLDMWSNLSYHVNQVGDEVINELPVGVLVIDENQIIRWVNQYAKEILGPNLIGQNLVDISKGFENISNKKTFLITTAKGKFEGTYKNENQAIYLFDVTKQEEISEKYFNSIPTLGFINFDNLEEALLAYDFSEQSALKTEYLTAISDWASRYEALLKPLSEDRLMLVTSREKLYQMTEERFSILDKVREISQRHSIKVSVSMGVASWDVNLEDLESYSQSAIELAEKRGGDQVVVNIQDQKIEYFGGKTDTLSKSSKVEARVNAQRLKDLIEEASNVLIMGHVDTDVDAFGAMLIINRIVWSMNKKSFMILDPDRIDKTVSATLKQINETDKTIIHDVISTAEALKKINNDTLLVIVDTQNPNIVHSKEILSKVEHIAVLDHHRTGDSTIEAEFSYIETAASSSVELCFELLQFFNKDIEISPIEATVMYAGLIIDTNDFTARTSPRTFEVAGKLVELDADATLVKIWLRRDLVRTLEINRLLNQIEIYKEHFAIVKTNKVYDDRVFLAQVSDQMLEIDGVDAAITIAKISDTMVGVSARSFAPINVQVLMEELGGGGHLQSAAAQIENSNIDEIYDRVKDLIDVEYGGGKKEFMKVILLLDVKGKGKKDDVIEVANGYGQFLINNKQALAASDENLKNLSLKKQQEEEAELKHVEVMQKIKSEIDGKSITIGIQIGKDDKLFGSVTTKQIVEEFENEYGIKIDKKKVNLSSDINSLGIYSATVDLYKGIKAQFEINIVEK
ncbi:50S ribosomal protein L9 [Acholeplasma sp. OttesenSCG-928-E16]|nr:50S ribosomal protein L9 [Acholeplasma sp. OttesenSCG-928-E16]